MYIDSDHRNVLSDTNFFFVSEHRFKGKSNDDRVRETVNTISIVFDCSL